MNYEVSIDFDDEILIKWTINKGQQDKTRKMMRECMYEKSKQDINETG